MSGSPLPLLAAEKITKLQRAVDELTVLNELARAISSTTDLNEIIKLIVTRAAAAVEAQQVVLTLVDSLEMAPGGTVFREVTPGESKDFHLTRNLLGCMCHERRALMINDVRNDPRLNGIPVDPDVRNLLCTPLIVDSELIAVMSACNKNGNGDFLEEDLRILTIMASQSAQVLERARLNREEALNAKIREDLIVAKRIQTCLLPEKSPEIFGYDVAGTSIPAREIGGDYFDFIPMNDDRWGIALGDVSGKGIAAALLMANLQAMLRGQAIYEGRCRNVMKWCNSQLFSCTPLEKFATLFWGVLDSNRHVFTYCNGGHELPFLISSHSEPRRLRTGGLAIGVLADFEYSDEQISLHEGDLLFIFSDGVTDVSNKEEEPFGETRLLKILQNHRDYPCSEIIEMVKKALDDFADDEILFDDLTMVGIKRN